MKTSFNFKKGFSLIEVLIALFILVIVILGGELYFYYGRSGIKKEEHRRVALELASRRLEELKATDYDSISGSTETIDTLPSGEITTVVQNQDGYKKVTVTVSWGESPGTTKVELVTLIAP